MKYERTGVKMEGEKEIIPDKGDWGTHGVRRGIHRHLMELNGQK